MTLARACSLLLLAACSSGPPPPAPAPAPEAPPPIATPTPVVTPPPAPPPSATTEVAPPSPCPEDMVYVDAVHCPDTRGLRVGLECTDMEKKGNANHLKICREFAPGQRCSVDKRRQRFCIDRYEFPSKKGAHPPVKVSAYDAAGLCAEQGKRMCFESEWVAACEGPDLKPFPYGHRRSAKHCNIDNPWVVPKLELTGSPRDEIRGPELIRLDQSVPSGSLETCQSDFGVYDLTGNFDEWVLTEWRRGKSKWAGLKGGAWGHVRNACRPITTSHVAHWSYYFISFRCCADPDPEAEPPLPNGGPPLWTHPAWSPPEPPGGRPISRGYTPPAPDLGPNRPFERWGLER